MRRLLCCLFAIGLRKVWIAGRVFRGSGAVLLSVVALAVLGPVGAAGASPMTFGAGSLVIPMDIGAGGQDGGMLRAYGLVYDLLRSGVPVHWAIEPSKPSFGDDFTIEAGTVRNLETAAAVALPRPYRGGPFLIQSTDRAAALPIVEAWLTAPDSDLVVHDVLAGSFTADIARTLVAAPRIGVLLNGDEHIAFNDLNAAGIRDSGGGLWSYASNDLLTETQVIGASVGDPRDGSLLHSGGLPRYCQLLAMPFHPGFNTEALVGEVRSWLDAGSLTHAFMQSVATTTFENASSGRFLTTEGIVDDGASVVHPFVGLPADPLSQIDGAFAADSGPVDSIGLASSSMFKLGARTLINAGGHPAFDRIVWLSGRMDGSAENGMVSYLAGHDYSIALPLSTNPQTNGVRLLLNGVVESPCARTRVQDDVELSLAAPSQTSASTITYTLSYANPGPRPVENVRLVDELPAGTTFESATGDGAHNGGVVTWNLGTLAAGASGSVQLTLSPAGEGSYDNVATAEFAHLAVRKVTSNRTTTSVVSDPPPPVFVFTGFAAPIDNALVNTAAAGQAIPVKYRLTARDGTPVSDAASLDSVTSQTGGGICAGLPFDAIETYAGGSGLNYLGDGNWQFNWKTPKNYAGQCRTMTLTLADGSSYTASFQFR